MTVQDRLQQIFREIFGDDDLIVSDTMTAADVPGWDSLAHINLIYAVEREFSIQIADDRLASFTTVGDLREHIEELSRVH
ncbi:acyl carrier protein [Frankia gtarii]|uniref:acyl carrier protein n=1 Tax=Frankia gtarii TaxID=2950102 RepID=UPI0021BE182D|nr:acyl carrier protein [Frankia gtarii]